MLIDVHRRAVLASVEIVSRAGPADLGRDTPCAGWQLRDLLAHMDAPALDRVVALLGRAPDWSPGDVRPADAAR
jgi:hypothetical protein